MNFCSLTKRPKFCFVGISGKFSKCWKRFWAKLSFQRVVKRFFLSCTILWWSLLLLFSNKKRMVVEILNICCVSPCYKHVLYFGGRLYCCSPIKKG